MVALLSSPERASQGSVPIDSGLIESSSPLASMRILVAIASFGLKNMDLLRRTIAQYRSMTFDVDIVVVSEAEKELDPDVKIVVGLPSTNPWSLPFAHKSIFAEAVDRYDLFIYSEDDIGVTEQNIQSFIDATQLLEAGEIAGFLRFEKDSHGTTWVPDAHSTFRWEPDSVVVRGHGVFASYSNLHAAFYILNRGQLKSAIASGGFLREPYEGKYDMLCTAATDPYTSCGFRKVVCTSELDSFLVHHMSDRYVGQMGMSLSAFTQQLLTLEQIGHGSHPATSLCEVESRIDRGEWSKDYYEHPHPYLLAAIPTDAKTVLSIGCGWGATEAKLIARGAHVTGLPLDSVIGAAAANEGVDVVYGTLDQVFAQLSGQNFDCVLIPNLLHLQQDPVGVVSRAVEFLAPNGALVIESPNFDNLAVATRQRFGKHRFNRLRSFEEGGVSTFRPATLRRWLRSLGRWKLSVTRYNRSVPARWVPGPMQARAKTLTTDTWTVVARQQSAK